MELSRTRILVTGAGGFIGTTLVQLLRDQGVSEISTGWRDLAANPQVDLVLHLAAPVDPRRDADPARMQAGIVELSLAVARSQPRARIVHVGTCEEYGEGTAPFHEDQAARPVSPYSRAKVEATERMLREHGDRVTVARPFLTYGPGQSGPRLVPSAIRAALSGAIFQTTAGTQTREFNFVEDIARGLLACRSEAVVGQIVNIGGGPELTVSDMVRRIYAACDADLSRVQPTLPARTGEVPRFFGDHRRARRLLDHRPDVDLDEGLRRTIAACKASTSNP
ncbi:MAG: NAD-dependent epimerase/dehydratase family protein [Proteobacteria bacterium]|nr:NAD-dependent epimerase/dehydratase family protein [Pseudomonadota bacterium]MCP4917611.1 NAD-dependent epimerase/dehydratase family protein [Pseudomonadota bacterium]